VRGFWHPVSAVYLANPRVLATPSVLRLMIAGEGRAEVVYAGDRMWPAIRHGEALVVRPAAGEPASGELVLAVEGGIPDVWRMARATAGAAVIADADPGPPRPLGTADVLGRIERARRGGRLLRSVPRTWLDLHEAAVSGPDPLADRADTVREKYDGQAVHYDRLAAAPIDPGLAARIVERVPRGARILVAGSGAGREAFALEQLGYDVTGVDFSPRMVAAAQAEAARRGSTARFLAADLRIHEEAAASCGAVVFTYDVYSFVPGRHDREAMLSRIGRWLAPGGSIFLSARRARGVWDRAMLSVQWLARFARGTTTPWGDSHTRWLDAAGTLRRSFVHVFTASRLEREVRAAGLRILVWDGGHGLLVPTSGATGEVRA
jgi:SAM-dependent methyltransferase